MATHTDHGHHTPNVHPAEQLASLFLGACLVRHGLKSDHPGHAGGLLSMAAGGLLIHRGLQGRCMLYERLGIDTRGEQEVNGRNTSEIHASVTIDRPAAELYREWRDLEHLSRILSHVHSIREIDDTTSRWIIDGPAGESIGFVSRITQPPWHHPASSRKPVAPRYSPTPSAPHNPSFWRWNGRRHSCRSSCYSARPKDWRRR